MTVANLIDHLQMLADAGRGDCRLVVAGHGALVALTYATSERADRVVVLYVEEAHDAGAARGAEGDPPSVAPQACGAGAVPSVRAAVAEGPRGPLDVQAGLFGEA